MLNAVILSIMYPDKFTPRFGVFIKREVDALSRYCKVKIVSPRPWSGKNKYFSDQNSSKIFYPCYLPLPGKLFNPIKGFWIFLFSLTTFLKIRKRFKFNLIHAHRIYPEGFSAVLLGKLFKVAVVVTVRGSDINIQANNFFIKKIIIYTLRKINIAFVVSQDLKKKLIELGAAEAKVRLISKGVDMRMFKPMDKEVVRGKLNLSKDKSIILYVGNFVPVKNPLAMVSVAFFLLNEYKENFFFVMVGDGYLKKKIKNRIRKANFDSDFYLAGNVLPEQIPFWMNAADILIVPSKNEGMPNVVYEAFACGLPVIASKVGGIPEIIEDGKNGFLVDFDDYPEFARKIWQLSFNKNLVNSVKSNGKKIIENKNLSWDNNALKIINIYKTVLEN